MPLRRLPRRLVACLVAAILLFAQTAALAYACQLEVPSVAALVAQPCPAHLDQGSGGEPATDGNLCKVHCETATPPDAATFDVMAVPPLAQSGLPRPHAAAAFPARAPDLHAAPPLPLLLRTSRLLI